MTERAPRIVTAAGHLAPLAPTLDQARTRAQEVVRYAVPDPGGPAAAHAATIEPLRTEVASQIDVVVQHVAPSVSPTGTATLRLGPEILVDWLFANPAHGLAFRELKQRAEMVLDTTNRNYALFQPSLVRSGANWKVECRNYGFQLILNGARDIIITYYNNL